MEASREYLLNLEGLTHVRRPIRAEASTDFPFDPTQARTTTVNERRQLGKQAEGLDQAVRSLALGLGLGLGFQRTVWCTAACAARALEAGLRSWHEGKSQALRALHVTLSARSSTELHIEVQFQTRRCAKWIPAIWRGTCTGRLQLPRGARPGGKIPAPCQFSAGSRDRPSAH